MFLMLSIAEIIIGVNEESLFGKGFSLFILRVLSLPSRSDQTVSPSIAMLMSLSDVFDGIAPIMFSAILINFNFCK